ncbi:hypothetical protein P8452_46878 [Trifolium repens]|nr:hypothetical protein P8452_46878 [Trifolium repens]
MHRSLAARRHDIISYFSSSSSSVRKVFSPNSKLFSSHTSKDDLEKVINILSNSDPNERGHQIYSSLDTLLLDLTTLDKNNFAHKVIETSCETKLVKTPRVPHADLIRFIKLVWKTNNKDLITTPVVESLVSSICYSAVPTPTKKNDILFYGTFSSILPPTTLPAFLMPGFSIHSFDPSPLWTQDKEKLHFKFFIILRPFNVCQIKIHITLHCILFRLQSHVVMI